MGDNYYNQQYPQGSNQRDPYAQNVYAQQPGYSTSTYQSPMDEGYRGSPNPQNLQVAQYDDHRRRSGEHGSRPRSRHGDSYYDDDRYSDRGHYLPPPSPSSRRPSSRGSHRDKDEHRKSEAKSIGATILGGVAGALIGRKAGHRDILPTVLGGVAGAWGGHKLEEEFTDRQGKGRERKVEGEMTSDGRGRERRRSNDSAESDKKSFREKVKDRIRSLSRKRTDDRERSRSSNRRRRDDSVDSYDSRRDRRQSGRYESEARDRYERDGRHDRDRDYY